MKKLILTLITLLLASGISFAQNQITRKHRQKTEHAPMKPTPKPTPTPKPQGAKVAQGYINGHEWVDLGLPSGLKWAACNVGASSSADYGDYYAWGETATKSSYNESKSRTYGRSIPNLQSAGIINGKGNLTPAYDAARANWGGSWRMPTKAEMEELVEKCTWTWTSQGGHNGYRVTGPNGSSIFLPAAGWREGIVIEGIGELGKYHCSTLCDSPDDSHLAKVADGLLFFDELPDVIFNRVSTGHSIRPVSD